MIHVNIERISGYKRVSERQ